MNTKNIFAKYLTEVEALLKAQSKEHKPEKWLAKNYVGGGNSKLEFLDLKIPKVRAIYKKGFTFSDLAPSVQWEIWDYIWQNSNIFEAMLFSSYFVASRPIEEVAENNHLIFSWVRRVDNWAHSDELSSHFAKVLELNHTKFLPQFKKWGKSKNPWEVRQSMVGLLYYSRLRSKYLPYKTLISLVEQHLTHSHYYVQKGVGWALREIYNIYPDQTLSYLYKVAAKIPAAGLTAATEKLPASQKKKLMKLRKNKN